MSASTRQRRRRKLEAAAEVERVDVDVDRDRVDQAERDEDDDRQRQQRPRPGEVGAPDPRVEREDAHAAASLQLPAHSGQCSSIHRAAVPTGAGRAPRASTARTRAAGTRLQVAQVGDQQFFGAAPVPVVVFGAAEPQHVLDDGVLGADLDVAVAAGAAVELARRSCGSARPRRPLRRSRAGSSACWAARRASLIASRARRSRRPSPGWRPRRGAGRAWRRAG